MPVTFETLPAEIRVEIYKHVFPRDVIQSLKPLGFRNPSREPPPPNVHITLRTVDLLKLYASNPAGVSLGRFWGPIALFAVSRQLRDESKYIWDRMAVQVGTWLSFLSNRPLELLALIRKFEFRFFVPRSWSPAAQPTLSFSSWLTGVIAEWTEKLAKLRDMYAHHPGGFSLDLTLMPPALLTFRFGKGVCDVKPEPLSERVHVVVNEALVKISAAGRWPDTEYIYDATQAISTT